jgi:predicted phosphodiesterase
MTRSLMVGDTHGNWGFWTHVFKWAKHLECDQIIQLGDFGLWPGSKGQSYLNKIDKASEESGIKVKAVLGNHDDWDQSDKLTDRNVRPNIHLFNKIDSFEQDGVKFGVIGGAVSIDRAYRTPGISYWPQETLTEGDVGAGIDIGKVDIMLTHDAGNGLPIWPGFFKDDPISNANRNAMQAIEDAIRPDLWLHGHYHRSLKYRSLHGASVFGLDSEPQGFDGEPAGIPSKNYWYTANCMAWAQQ